MPPAANKPALVVSAPAASKPAPSASKDNEAAAAAEAVKAQKLKAAAARAAAMGVSAAAKSARTERMAIAMFDFDGSQGPTCLALRVGDRIVLSESEPGAEWWWGTCNRKNGCFPAAYVKVLENEAPTAADRHL